MPSSRPAQGTGEHGEPSLDFTSSPDSILPPESLTALPSPPAMKRPPMPSQIKVIEKPQMLEINPGIWDGLTPEHAKKYYPEDWDRFTKDPYSYRVPRAESYHDLSGMGASVISSHPLRSPS